jgi:hypothetical protein
VAVPVVVVLSGPTVTTAVWVDVTVELTTLVVLGAVPIRHEHALLIADEGRARLVTPG